MAAVSYSKYTGNLGAALVTTDCGGTNTITGVLHAWQDNVPCIFISGQCKRKVTYDQNQLHEANLLKLDCSKAHIKLQWKNVWNSETAFEKTVNWYKAFYENGEILTKDDLDSYINDAKDKNITWAK